jgi:hypothetical protein
MMQIFIDADPEELKAWLRGTPKKVAAPQPAPNRATKTFIITVPSRDVVVLPTATWPEERFIK